MLLYIDSLFAEGRDRVVTPLHTIPDTLNKVYLLAMREHARPAVLMHWQGGEWRLFPDWRFDRHVIRLALYLRERVGIAPGNRVAVVSELRPEPLLLDFAAAALGAVSVAVGADESEEELAGILAEAAPRAAFVSGAALNKVEAVRDRISGLEQLVVFDPVTPEDRAVLFSSVVDLGGTLDTPERASSLRNQARAVSPDQPAVRHYERSADGSLRVRELTQAETIERLKRYWFGEPAREGDLVYVAGSDVMLRARLALWAFVADGSTTAVLGTPGREWGEIAALRPDKIVAPPAVLEGALRRRLTRTNGRPKRFRDWVRRAAAWTSVGRLRPEDRGIREALGGRARWICPTAPLEPALSARLSAVVAVGPDTQPRKEGIA